MIKDYDQSYHLLEIEYNYDIPLKVDQKFYEYVCHHLREFALGLKRLKQDYRDWSINVYFKEDKHFYRLKLKFKNKDVCSYYKDNGEVKKEGKLCSKVPREIEQFLNSIIENCWDHIVSMIKNREDVYDELKWLLFKFKEHGKADC